MVWTKEYQKEYDRKYREAHREHIRILHRENQRKHRHSKIKRTHSFCVTSLGVVFEHNYTFPVEPLSVIKKWESRANAEKTIQ